METIDADTNGGLEVLVVENSMTQALKLKHVVQGAGYRVAVARGGEDALAILAREGAQFVLTEALLPEVDGYELCRRIKTHPGLRQTIVILLTSFSDPSGIFKILECGADSFLAKPYDANALLEHLAEVKANRAIRSGASDPPREVYFGAEKHSLPEAYPPRLIDLLLASYRAAARRTLELRGVEGRAERLSADLRDALSRRSARQGTIASPILVPGLASPDEARRAVVAAPPRGRVLIAEDSYVNVRLATHIVEAQGFSVVAVPDGTQVLEALEKDAFDLILMDVELPQMDGIEATERIRAREEGSGSRIPIIAMTAHNEKDVLNRCMEAGMDSYIAKPLTPSGFLDAVSRATHPPTDDRAPGAIAGAARDRDPEAPVVFDRYGALERMEGDVDLLREIIRLFLRDSPKLVEQIRLAIQSGEGAVLEHAAHSLKGSAASLGALQVADAAERLEYLGHQGEMAEAPAAETALQSALSRAVSTLALELTSPAPLP